MLCDMSTLGLDSVLVRVLLSILEWPYKLFLRLSELQQSCMLKAFLEAKLSLENVPIGDEQSSSKRGMGIFLTVVISRENTPT